MISMLDEFGSPPVGMVVDVEAESELPVDMNITGFPFDSTGEFGRGLGG